MRLTPEEETMVSDSTNYFDAKGTPNDRRSVKDMVETLVSNFSVHSQRSIGFKDN